MQQSTDSGAFTPAYRAYALALLVVVYIFNFIDRSILGILVEPIKQDLGVSDTLMGFLGGSSNKKQDTPVAASASQSA